MSPIEMRISCSHHRFYQQQITLTKGNHSWAHITDRSTLLSCTWHAYKDFIETFKKISNFANFPTSLTTRNTMFFIINSAGMNVSHLMRSSELLIKFLNPFLFVLFSLNFTGTKKKSTKINKFWGMKEERKFNVKFMSS